MTVAPVHYKISGLPYYYLAFRTERTGGRTLLSLVPDVPEQHPLDVVCCFLDEPRLAAWVALTGAVAPEGGVG